MVLTTDRLILRPYTLDDVDALHHLWTDPGVRRYLWDNIIIEREKAEEYVLGSLLVWKQHGIGQFCVSLRETPAELAGFCGLHPFGEPQEFELLYGLYPRHWGKGYAVEASRAVLEYAFTHLGIPRVAARTDPPNSASIRVMQKLGMRDAGKINAGTLVCYWLEKENFRP